MATTKTTCSCTRLFTWRSRRAAHATSGSSRSCGPKRSRQRRSISPSRTVFPVGRWSTRRIWKPLPSSRSGQTWWSATRYDRTEQRTYRSTTSTRSRATWCLRRGCWPTPRGRRPRSERCCSTTRSAGWWRRSARRLRGREVSAPPLPANVLSWRGQHRFGTTLGSPQPGTEVRRTTNMMRRLLTTLSVLILIMGLDISSFAAGAQEEGAAGKRVAVLFPGLVDDQSWNQAGFEGLTRLEEEGAEIAYTERVNQSQQVEVFRNYAQQGYDIIVGHGGEYMDAALQVATEYPDLQFVVTNGNKGADNVTSFTLSYRDMGLLAGALAGLMTESNKLAIVTARKSPSRSAPSRGSRRALRGSTPRPRSTSPTPGRGRTSTRRERRRWR